MYAGNRYGTLRSELERPARGIVLEIDLQGARQVREALPEARADLHRAAVARGPAPPARGRGVGHARADRASASTCAPEELAAKEEFAYRVVNDDLERALEELVRACRYHVSAATRRKPP